MSVASLGLISPTLINGAYRDLAFYTMVFAVPLGLLWLGFARGSYVTIEDNSRIYGKFFFIRGSTTLLSDVISIDQRSRFGTMSDAFLKYRKKDGTVGNKGIVSKQSMQKGEFRKLMLAIRSANPKNKIDPNLVGE